MAVPKSGIQFRHPQQVDLIVRENGMWRAVEVTHTPFTSLSVINKKVARKTMGAQGSQQWVRRSLTSAGKDKKAEMTAELAKELLEGGADDAAMFIFGGDMFSVTFNKAGTKATGFAPK